MVSEPSIRGSSSAEMVWGRIGGGSWDRRANSSIGGVGGGATRHLLGEMPSHQKAATGGILRITVSHVLYPVMKEVLHQVLEAYGVEKMSMFERVNQVEAMVQLRSWQGAERARDALHGRCIYDRCCFLDVQLVQPTIEPASTKMARRDAVASVCAPEVVVEATCSSPPDKPSASTDEPKSEPLSPPTPGCEWDDMSDEQKRRCLKMVIEVKETLYNRLGWPLSSRASSDATAPEDSTDTTAGLDGVDAVPLSQGKEQPLKVLEVVPMKTHGSSDDDQPPRVTAPTSTSVAGKDHDAAAPILVADATLVNGRLVVVDQLVVLWPHPVKCVGWSPWSPPSQVTSMSHGAEAQAMPWPSFRWDRCDEQLKQPWPPPLFLLNEVVALDCQDAQVGLIAHPLNASSSGVGVPLAFPPPDQNPSQISGAKNRTIQRCRTREMSTSCVEPTNSMVNTGAGSAVENMQEAPCLDIDVASSTLGEVKMSLKCSVDPSKFRMPSLEAVFKMVEDKCLRSHKILPPDFSIGSLMNEICQCVVQLGSDHTAEHNLQSDVGNGSSSQNESMTSNAPFVKPIACKNGGNGKYKAAEESLVLEGSENGPPNSTVAQQQPYLALSKLSTIHDVTDISKGAERVRISVVNEFGSEKCPPSFYYIPRNLVFQNAYVNISVARIGDEDCCADCYGNCLSAPIPCACARETGGEYAYTLEGLVRTAFLDECVSMNRFPEKHHRFFCKYCPLERSRNEASPEPCRGHLVRKFIKECWSKCGCNMQCGNRVVQRGITCNLQVFFTGEGKGWGLRTLDELAKGAFVSEYVGEVLTNTELYERTVQSMHNARHKHPVLLDADWGSEGMVKDKEALCLDGTFYGNVGRFINHRCYDANLVVIPVEVETPDHHYYHLAFFTTKKVEAFEELTWDYGIDFDDDKHPVKAFQCLCGSRYCRGRKHPRKRSKASAK